VKRRTVRLLFLAALVCASAALASAQASRIGNDQRRIYEFDVFGPSYEAALEQAGVHAVRSAIGEFYCSEEMLLARSLLERYVENYHQRFVDSQKILSRRESQGMVYLRVTTIVNLHDLEQDLREKRFFYTPRRRPYAYVSIAETVEGQAVDEPVSRAGVHEALDRLLLRHQDEVPTSAPVNLDLKADPTVLTGVLEAAQRAGVEILITGAVALTKTQERKIHFDDYTFYRAQADLTLIRADDGRVVAQGAFLSDAGHTDPDMAKRLAAAHAVGTVLDKIVPSFSEEWDRTMTDNVEYQVAVVGVSPDEAEVIRLRLQTRLTPARVYRRSHFEDVVVFNLYYPPDTVRPGERQRVEETLREVISPQLVITPGRTRKQIRAVIAS